MLGIGIGVPFNVRSLIARVLAIFVGKTGYWGRPILLSSLFQDSAGTTPVTAVEQPVGRVLDQSGSGNHASQGTAAARPVLSERVNLLIKTDQFDDAVWGKIGVSVSADEVTALSTTETFSQDFSVTPGASYTLTFEAQRGSMTNAKYSVFNVTAGADIVASTSYYAQTNATTFSPITVTFTAPAGCVSARVYPLRDSGSTGTTRIRYPQVNPGTTASRYQRVNTATDYDTAGFPSYLKFDGVDDSLSSATGGAGNAGFFFCVVVQAPTAIVAAGILFSDRVGFRGYQVWINPSKSLEFSVGNGTARTAVGAPGTLTATKSLVMAWDDGINLNLQLNNNTPISIARPVVVAGSASFVLGKSSEAAEWYFPGNIYSPVYVRNSGLTAPERLTIRRQVADEAGITL